MQSFTDKKTRTLRPRLKAVLFRLGVLLVVLSPLAIIEILVRIFVPAPPPASDDPYVSFAAVKPLFVLDSAGQRYETDPSRLTYFQTQSFAGAKGPRTKRIFCLGGSTVQGRPYSTETAFGTWLQLNLQAADSRTAWEVINCGGISYASYRLVPIMQELVQYQPDLFIIYTGHNEFLEDRTYGRLKNGPPALVKLHRTLLGLRTYRLADEYLASHRLANADESRTVLPAEVDAKLDYEQGLQSYHHDELWRQGVIHHFRRNLERMIQIAGQADVPVILVKPVSNLKDCPPFKSEFSVAGPERQQVLQLWERAREVDWSNPAQKANLLQQAADIDSRHAGLLYLLAECYQRMGRPREAKTCFLRAKEEDVCPLRILEPMSEAIVETANRCDVPLIDANALIADRTDDGIPGDEWLEDHVHPTVTAHQLIAESLFGLMEQMSLVVASPDTQTRRNELWMNHLSSLSDVYYAHGAARLKRLRQWAQGRIPKSPAESEGEPD